MYIHVDPIRVKDWDRIVGEWQRDFEYPRYVKSDCMHDNCPSCGGTGQRKDGRGTCVHMMSCPCRKCNPYTL